MGKKYYIQYLQFTKKDVDKGAMTLRTPEEKNLVELNTEEDKNISFLRYKAPNM